MSKNPPSIELVEILRRSQLPPSRVQDLAQSSQILAAEIPVLTLHEAIQSLHDIRDVKSLYAIARVVVGAKLLATLGAQQLSILRAAVRNSFREEGSVLLMRALVRHIPDAPDAWIDYGTMNSWRGKNWEARRCFLIGLRLGGERGQLLPKLAGACRRIRRFDEASAWLGVANIRVEHDAVQIERDYVNYFRSFTEPQFLTSWEEFRAKANMASPALVVDHLRTAVRDKQPLSLIRLGDGEGNLIAHYREKSNLGLALYCQAIVRIMFGDGVGDYRAFAAAIETDFERAIRNADILGVLLEPIEYQLKRHGVDRQSAGNLANARDLVNRKLKPALICTSIVHHSVEMLDFLKERFREERAVGMITCRPEVGGVVEQKYPCRVRLYQVPGEAKAVDLSNVNAPHFPNVFREVCSRIQVDYPGQIFLIGAGLLGKIYCDIVKTKGGIAIDVGSVFDAWAGKLTRAPFVSMSSRRFSELFGL